MCELMTIRQLVLLTMSHTERSNATWQRQNSNADNGLDEIAEHAKKRKKDKITNEGMARNHMKYVAPAILDIYIRTRYVPEWWPSPWVVARPSEQTPWAVE